MKKLTFLLLSLLLNENIFSQTLVKNIAPGLTDGYPTNFYRFDNNKIVFFANDGGTEGLYITDGTTSGTIKLVSYNGIQNSGSINVGSQLGFTVIDSLGYLLRNITNGYSLIRTNGTLSGTKTFTYNLPSSNANNSRFFKLGNYICWTYTTGVLAKYNVLTNAISTVNFGSQLALKILYYQKNYNSGNTRTSTPSASNEIDEVLTNGNYFFAYASKFNPQKDTIYRIDVNGIKQAVVTTTVGILYGMKGVLVNGKYVFSSDMNTSTAYQGVEPYYFNPITNAFGILKDINPYFNYSSNPKFLLHPFDAKGYTHQKIYFTANHADYGQEVWVTDGTTAGTNMVMDYKPGPVNGIFSLWPFKSYYLGDSVVTSNIALASDTLRLITPSNILNYPSLSPNLQTNSSWSGYDVYSWRKGNELFLIDGYGMIYKAGYSSNTIDTIGNLNCVGPIMGGYSSIMELNGCLIFNQKDCSFTGYELYKYCNNTLYSLGISEKEKIESKKIVYPNPSNGKFTFDGLTESYLIEVTDLTGRVIYTIQLDESKNSIDLQEIPSGLYLYKLRNKQNQVQQGKLLLQ